LKFNFPQNNTLLVRKRNPVKIGISYNGRREIVLNIQIIVIFIGLEYKKGYY